MTKKGFWAAAVLMAAVVPGRTEAQVRMGGDVSLETRGFLQSPLWAEQNRHAASLSARPELHWSWDGGRQRLSVELFGRWDAADRERTHADVRVLTWERAWRSWEVRVGLGTVFWGVTESQHLVDVINQTDGVEDVDGEDKLGQPMVHVAAVRDWGTVDFFLLPGFRQRTFPGLDGRLRLPLPVDPDRAVYESSAGSRRLDWAARWSHYVGSFDVGVSFFRGTNREPRLVPGRADSGPVLVPHYDVIDQTGVDVQYTTGPWLWKAEGVTRAGGHGGRHWAGTLGFEWTTYQVLGTDGDLGVLVEYLWDDRAGEATTPFEDDLFVGLRLAMNDVQSSSLLVGSILDRDTGAGFYLVEGRRRLGASFTLTVEARGVWGVEASDILGAFRRDTYLSLDVAWWG